LSPGFLDCGVRPPTIAITAAPMSAMPNVAASASGKEILGLTNAVSMQIPTVSVELTQTRQFYRKLARSIHSAAGRVG